MASAKWDETLKSFVVEFDAPAEGVAVGDMVYSQAYLPKVSISDSTFQGQRSRGILLSSEAQVTNCTIRGTGYAGILIKGGIRHGYEGPAPSDIAITGCTFEGCGGAAVYAYADGMDYSAGAINRLVISGNTIRDLPNLDRQRFKGERPTWMHWASGVSVFSAKDLKITDNVFQNIGTAIYLRRDSDVVVDGNKVTPPANLLVDEPTCTNVTVGHNNTGLTRQPATPDIRPDLEYVNDMR